MSVKLPQIKIKRRGSDFARSSYESKCSSVHESQERERYSHHRSEKTTSERNLPKLKNEERNISTSGGTFSHLSHSSAWFVIISSTEFMLWTKNKLIEIRRAKIEKETEEKLRFTSRMNNIVQENPLQALKIISTCMIFGWRLKLKAKIARKKMAADCTINFLREYLRIKIPVFIHRYRFHAVKLQRYIRNYQVVTAARRKVIFLLWQRLERKFVSKDLPVLLAKAEEIRLRALLRRPDEWIADEVKPLKTETAYFPRLVKDINNVKNQMTELRYTLVRTKLLMERAPLRIICKPVHVKTREQSINRMNAVEIFLRDVREEYKQANTTTTMRHKTVAATIEDAKELLRRRKGVGIGYERNNYVSVRVNCLQVYTGQARDILVKRMEALVCDEQGLLVQPR